jgi:hypothetical protein
VCKRHKGKQITSVAALFFAAAFVQTGGLFSVPEMKKTVKIAKYALPLPPDSSPLRFIIDPHACLPD